MTYIRIEKDMHRNQNEEANWKILEQERQKLEECASAFHTLRTGDADLRFYITTVQDG